MDGHFKSGRTYMPPMMAIPELQLADWVRDDVPDLLWPICVLALGGNEAAVRMGRFQQDAASALKTLGIPPSAVRLDGRMTSLERVDEPLRGPLGDELSRLLVRHALLPDELVVLLRAYNGLPAAWLWVDRCEAADTSVTLQQAHGFLAGCLTTAVRDGHVEALVKFVGLAWDVVTGQMKTTVETIRHLQGYPGDAAGVPVADTIIRAMFGANAGFEKSEHPDWVDARITWARSFWQQNWEATPCLVPARDPEPVIREASESSDDNVERESADRDTQVEPADPETADDAAPPAPEDGSADDLRGQILTSFDTFLADVTHPDFPIDLYEPARHEVTCGLVTRAVRLALGVLESPTLWCSEHASGVIRAMAETEIVLSWMAQQDDAIYRKYQEYGIGKAKLQRRRMAELAAKFDGNPPAYLTKALEHAHQRLGGDHGEEFVNVNLDATFAGTSIRQMAAECGLDELYAHVYQSASSIAHGEWDPIDDLMMSRCRNPLHRWHRLPDTDLSPARGDGLGAYFAAQVASLCDLARSQLAQAG